MFRHFLGWLRGDMRLEPEPQKDEDIASLLLRWNEPNARNRLFALIYPELRRVADYRMRRERSDHTLQPTALVNEVFLHLVRMDSINWQSRAHFLAIASEAMRRILVDHARNRTAQRRPGGQRVPLDPNQFATGTDFEELVALDDLLDKLSGRDPRLARVVELRYFGGLTFEEIGEVLGVSDRTAKRDWQMARAWLYTAMNRRENPGDGFSTVANQPSV